MANVTGVLAMAYGTPRNLDEVEGYYTDIRRGRPPSPAQVAELKARYEAIGGLSPLLELTDEQARRLEERLNAQGDRTYRVFVGMKHWHPYIADTVRKMASDGIKKAVGFVLTPQYSEMSVGEYISAAEAAANEAGLVFEYVRSWHCEPQFIEALSRRVAAALDEFPEPERHQVPVIFTAHSLPASILEKGDPYHNHLVETGAHVASRLGLERWQVAYQSASATGVPWLGPDILDVLRELYDQGDRRAVVCTAGFVADHLEVLYDIDIEAQQVAGELGLQLVRAESLNAAPDFIEALAKIVTEAAGRLESR